MPISLRLSRMSVDFATAYHERDGFGPPEAQAAGMCIGDFGKIADCGVDRVGSAFRQFERAVQVPRDRRLRYIRPLRHVLQIRHFAPFLASKPVQ